jgi:hypothetical protein
MTRTMSPTPVRPRKDAPSPSVENLIKTLVRDGMNPSHEVLVERVVSIADDDSGGDPYNHTGRFRKIFK